jgi:hypothetical protein
LKAIKRYGFKSPGFHKYFEMATKMLMSPKGDATELRLSLDSMQKSDAKVFGFILVDF